MQAYLVASTMQIYAQQLLSTHSCKHAVTKNAGKSHTRKNINKCAYKVSTQSATIMNNTQGHIDCTQTLDIFYLCHAENEIEILLHICNTLQCIKKSA